MDQKLHALRRAYESNPDDEMAFRRLLTYASRIGAREYFIPYLKYLHGLESQTYTSLWGSDAALVFPENIFAEIEQEGHNENVFIIARSGNAISAVDAIFRRGDGSWEGDWTSKDLKPPKGFKKTIFNETNIGDRYDIVSRVNTKPLIVRLAKEFKIPISEAHDLAIDAEMSKIATEYVPPQNFPGGGGASGHTRKIPKSKPIKRIADFYPSTDWIEYTLEIWGNPGFFPNKWIEGTPESKYESLLRKDVEKFKKELPEIIVDYDDREVNCFGLVSHIAFDNLEARPEIDTSTQEGFTQHRNKLKNDWIEGLRFIRIDTEINYLTPFVIGVGYGYTTFLFVLYINDENQENILEIASEIWPTWFAYEDEEDAPEIRLLVQANEVYPAKQLYGDTYELINRQEITLGCYE